MDLNFLTLYIILVLTLICPTQPVYGREQKGPAVRHLCGKNFINTWHLLCRLKQLKAAGRGRKKKRSLEGKAGYEQRINIVSIHYNLVNLDLQGNISLHYKRNLEKL